MLDAGWQPLQARAPTYRIGTKWSVCQLTSAKAKLIFSDLFISYPIWC
jgi:hypothetical protein